MALIGKIRKNLWIVLILVGVALAGFIVMDMSGAQNLGGGTSQMVLGKINGQKLNWNEFQITEQILYGNAGGDLYQRRDALWNYFVEKAILDKEAEKLGLYVSNEELMDLQFGQNLSPVIRQNWVNPQTGQLDMAQLLQFKQAIENNQPLDPRFRQFWAEQEKQIIKDKVQDKLQTMVSKSMFTPTWLVNHNYSYQNSFVDFNYVKIPFDQIQDESIVVSDNDLSAYLKNNSRNFQKDKETRRVDYAIIDILPTSEDSLLWEQEISDLVPEFVSTSDDSIFAINNNGFYANYFYKPEELSDSLGALVPTMNPGEVKGPFIEGGGYRAVKLIESRIVPDSVKARHILKSVTAGDLNQLNNARNLIDSLKTLYVNRTESFDSLANKFSDDPTSKIIGGDLGYFTQGRMVGPFNDVCFHTGKTGGVYTVETQFGVHLIEITEQVFTTRAPKYKVAFINVPIIPSQQTQDNKLDEASELIATHPYLDDLSKSLSERNDINLEPSADLEQNDFIFGNLGTGNTSRDIIRWAFDPSTSKNDVSPEVYIYTDPVNYFNSKYVIIGLKNISKPGLRSVEDSRDEIENLVLNQKKSEYLKSQISAIDLQSIATQYSVEIDSATNVSLNSTFIPGLGNEPEVMASAAKLNIGETSGIITGNSGVFVVQLVNKAMAGEASNIVQLRNQESSSARNRVSFQMLEALKKNAKVKDNRFTFY